MPGLFINNFVINSFVKLRFILPCQSECHPIFDITQFVTQFTHVSRHFGAKGKKQQTKARKKTVLVIWSQICGKMSEIVRLIA